ncbi:uncharacterized protein O3C94_020564 [Discoglossus pictus]
MRGSYVFLLLCLMCILDITRQGAHAFQYPDLLMNTDEEANTLSRALLQLGWRLKAEVNHTRETISSIFKQLDKFNTSLTKIFQQVIQSAKVGETLDTKARHFLGNETIYQVVTELYEELAKLRIHREMLDNKIKPLERKMQRAVIKEKDTSNILSLIKRQHIRIDALMEVVDLHQDRINSQEVKIQRLLKKEAVHVEMVLCGIACSMFQ